MNCNKYQNLVYEYVDGSLSPELEKEINSHLKDCRECFEIYKREANLSELLKNIMFHKTSSLFVHSSLINRLINWKEKRKSSVPAAKKLTFALKPAALLVSILLIFLILIVVYSPKINKDKTTDINYQDNVFSSEEDLTVIDPREDWLERRIIFTIVDEKRNTRGKIITSKSPEKTIMYWEKIEEEK